MSDAIEVLISSWTKYIATGAIGIVTWLGGGMLSDIKDYQRRSAQAQTNMLVEMTSIKEQLGARSIDSLHQAAQIEDIRTQMIDLRMRVNTLEQKSQPHR